MGWVYSSTIFDFFLLLLLLLLCFLVLLCWWCHPPILSLPPLATPCRVWEDRKGEKKGQRRWIRYRPLLSFFLFLLFFFLRSISCCCRCCSPNERPAIPAVQLSSELAEAASSAGRSSFHSLLFSVHHPFLSLSLLISVSQHHTHTHILSSAQHCRTQSDCVGSFGDL